MRVLIVDTSYPQFLAAHYASRPGLEDLSYREQWQSIMATFFGTADAYSHYLGELGHEAHELIVNAEPLQRAWAREHGLTKRRFRFGRRGPAPDVVLAQIEDFRPDVVYVQNLGILSVEMLRRIRGMTRLLVAQLGSEPPLEQLAEFPLVCTSFPHFVPRLRARGQDTEYLGIAFDPRVLARVDPAHSNGAVFVGTLARAQWRHANVLIEQAARRAPIDIWGHGGGDWPADSPFRTNWQGEAWGLDMYRVLGDARIAVNRHGDIAEDYANNMRLYEATGVGTLLLTDDKRNMTDLFDVGEEVVVYRDEDELVRLIDHYLSHEDERAAIAAAGQRRTLAEHTYAHRMQDLADILARRL